MQSREIEVDEHERRAAPRAPASGKAVMFIGDQRLRGATLDVSTRGLGVVSPVPAYRGCFVRVNFWLDGQCIDADAAVARISMQGEGAVLGLQFQGVHPKTVERIRDYVDRRAGRPADPREDEGDLAPVER